MVTITWNHTDCLTLQALFYRSTELKANQLKERRTFPRSICRYSSLSLLSFGLPHQALGPLRRAYLGSHSSLSVDEAVICLSAMIPVDIPRERTQSGEWEKIAPDNFTITTQVSNTIFQYFVKVHTQRHMTLYSHNIWEKCIKLLTDFRNKMPLKSD